jgi:hypothetical protein
MTPRYVQVMVTIADVQRWPLRLRMVMYTIILPVICKGNDHSFVALSRSPRVRLVVITFVNVMATNAVLCV